MRIYLDTAPIIYLVENVRAFNTPLLQQLSAPNILLVISDLSRLECRVKPMRDGNQILLEGYEKFFRDAVRQILPLSPDVIDLATEIRAHFGFKVPDAIHLAAATAAECALFLTNDKHLQLFDRIRVTLVNSRVDLP